MSWTWGRPADVNSEGSEEVYYVALQVGCRRAIPVGGRISRLGTSGSHRGGGICSM